MNKVNVRRAPESCKEELISQEKNNDKQHNWREVRERNKQTNKQTSAMMSKFYDQVELKKKRG